MANTDVDAERFIGKWKGSAASELSTSQSFLIDVCELLGVDRPHATLEQDYMFERPLTFQHADGSKSAGRVDLYRRGAFVLESKKLKAGAHTKGFDEAMLRAHSQAQRYARALPAAEGRPPFLVVVDVGHRIELFSEFSRSGGSYVPFPDPRSYRIALDDLRDPDIRERLRKVWLDPLSLDPSRESARVTREIAKRLAELARSLEASRHTPEAVAQFLMRCLFTMFAEDVRLLPKDSFRNLLLTHADNPDVAMRMLAQLWQDMDGGGFSAVLAGEVLRFNGKLFKQPDTLPLDKVQIELLVEAARADWKHVEPAIFGTLLERALSPGERHKLGAHYTPRAYVERLVLPTVIEPLRGEWSDAQAAALTLAAEGKQDEAVAELLKFHHRLCNVRVLDPACGSGNFLYVTLEHLKRLEGEVLLALDELGFRQTGLALDGERADAAGGETVDPHNLLGIEINPRAAAIAEVVLWIGYLQWHYRTRGNVHPPQPVIRDFRNIENRDAVLAYDSVEFVTDEHGIPMTRWDGVTMKVSPVTGEDVPDDTARKPVERYLNPRKAAWPQADFVVGNPPFIGNKRMRTVLGDGYAEALRGAWPDVPESADFVMYWWHSAALMTRRGALRRFGFITTNSIRQSFNRRLIEKAMQPGGLALSGDGYKERALSLVFAVPDHPWVDVADGAAVRIAMTVLDATTNASLLLESIEEREREHGETAVIFSERRGKINADLTVGADVSAAVELMSNRLLACPGVQLSGQGFVVPPELVASFPQSSSTIVRPFVIGSDLVQMPRGNSVVDATDLTEQELRDQYPDAYQWLFTRVKPDRDQNPRESYRTNWWRFSEPRIRFRPALVDLPRAIGTCRTSKHRVFMFLPPHAVAETTVVVIALADALSLGVLSSTIHQVWAFAAGGTLENRPRYQHQRTFNSFPFPSLANEQGEGIRTLAEQIDAHRKRGQAQNAAITVTGMYNVLEKLRSGEALTDKERVIHEQGLVSVLRQIHDELDEAVLQAYGWSDLLPMLRVAHGNDQPASLLPPGEGARRADEGVAVTMPGELAAIGESPPSHTEGASSGASGAARHLLPGGGGKAEAKRAFDEAILERLVALNAQRAAAEARGEILWLRPEFQNPEAQRKPEQGTLEAGSDSEGEEEGGPVIAAPAKPVPWPKDTLEQVRALAELLNASAIPLTLDDIAARYTARGPWKKRLPKLLEMLVALGRAREEGGRYVS